MYGPVWSLGEGGALNPSIDDQALDPEEHQLAPIGARPQVAQTRWVDACQTVIKASSAYYGKSVKRELQGSFKGV